MATSTKQPDTDDDPPVIYDRDRWDGEVTVAKTVLLSWGTHTIEARLQDFDDGDSHIYLLDIPSSPPPYAEAWLTDWMDSHEILQSAANVLADDWDIDIDEVSR